MRSDELTETDRRFLDAAFRLAMRHVGQTRENPSVGCLIVRDGRIVGRGVTAFGGRPHAERIALDEAGDKARGATAYVTLEPCAHHGRTPPCAEALIEAGMARVVIGASDPDPRVDGRGVAILEMAGVAVLHAPGFDPRSIQGFLSRVTRRRPFLTLKLAISAEGYIGREGAGQVAISGPIANRQTHLLRARSDLVMIGVGTALADDPQLTVRLDGLSDRSPPRLVLDPDLRIDPNSRLVRSAAAVATIVATRSAAPATDALSSAGVELLALRSDEGMFDDLLAKLAARGVGNILCEGGARLAGALLREGHADRLVLIRSPRRIGPPGLAVPELDQHLQDFDLSGEQRLGKDRWLEYCKRTN